MTKDQFIEEWKHCDVTESEFTENKFKDDLDAVIASEQLRIVMNGPMCMQNGYEHVQKCPNCDGWIFFNDKDLIFTSVGSMKRKMIHCDACKKDQLIYPWRCL